MSAVVEIPMPYKGEMVCAVLADIKTQTRRLWKMPKGLAWYHGGSPGIRGEETGDLHDPAGPAWCSVDEVRCPYGRPGDRHWVREAWLAPLAYELTPPRDIPAGTPLLYLADGAGALPKFSAGRYRPPMFMPRWASRITCEVTEVRVERLQDISEADAKAEGCDPLTWNGEPGLADLIDWPLKTVDRPYANAYALLWESINGDGSWAANPWVWAVTFRRLP